MRVLAVCLCLLPATTLAADAALAQCVAIDDALERLACYDAAAGRSVEPPVAAPLPMPSARPGAQPRAQQPQPAPEPVVAAPPAPAAAPQPVPAPAPRRTSKPADDDFGKERIRDDQKQEIVTRYEGEFTGWSGRTVFRLENGQVWKQAEPGRFRTSMDRPVIRIQRGAFGSYRLKVEGLNRTIRVKRIR